MKQQVDAIILAIDKLCEVYQLDMNNTQGSAFHETWERCQTHIDAAVICLSEWIEVRPVD